jgi:hypothetical protein
MAKKAEGSLKAFGMPFDEGVQEHDSSLNEREHGIDRLVTAETGRSEEAPAEEEKAPSRSDKLQELAEIEQGTTVAPEEEAPAEEDEGAVDLQTQLDQLAGIIPAAPVEGEEDTRLSASEQALREKYARQSGRLEALEEQIRDRQPAPADAEPAVVEDEGPDYSDPRVQAALAEALSDPERVGPTLQILVQAEAERLVNKQVGPIAEQLGEYKARAEETEKRSEANAQLSAGLSAAYEMGGIEAALVLQAQKHGPDSILVKYLQQNPVLATSADGIVAATMAVARVVQRQEGFSDSLPSEAPTTATPSLTSGRPTTAAGRGQKLNKPKEEKSEEETMRDMIRDSRRQSFKLDFMR